MKYSNMAEQTKSQSSKFSFGNKVTSIALATMLSASLASPVTAFATDKYNENAVDNISQQIDRNPNLDPIVALKQAMEIAKEKMDAAKEILNSVTPAYEQSKTTRDDAASEYNYQNNLLQNAEDEALGAYTTLADKAVKAFEKAEQDLLDAQTQKTEAEDNLKKITEDLSQAEDAAEDAEEALKQAQENADSAPEEIKRLEGELEKAEGALEKLRSELKNAQDELSEANDALTTATENKNNAQAKYNSAFEAYCSALEKEEAAEKEYLAKKEAYESLAEEAGPELNAALEEVNQAKEEWDKAVQEKTNLENDLTLKKQELEDLDEDLKDAQIAQETAQENYGTTEKEYETAKETADTKLQEYEDALETQKENNTAYGQALEDLETAQEDFDAAKKALEDFKLKKETAEKAYQDAVTAINNSEATLAALEEEYNKGVYGFFEELGYQNCIDILNNAKYAASTNVNTTGDATQLDQMKQIVAMMKRCNEIRESVGLDPYQVSLELIAIAMSNTNWSSSNIAHSQQFNVGENLSWGWTDPFEGWYFEEKAVYDRIKAELGYSGDNTKDSSALQNQIRAIATQNGEQVGHYLAVISQTYKYFGMAVNSERGQNMYGTTWGMTLSQGGQYTLHAMTVDGFEKLLKDYLDSVDPDLYLSKLEGDLSKAETAKNDTTAEFNKADSALTTATNALGVAKEHKEKLYEATQDDILKVATALEDYNKAKDIADQKLKEKDSFEDELEKKNSALEVAKENYESKEFEITSLQTEIGSQETEIASKEEIYEAKSGALDELNEGLSIAKAVMDKAEIAFNAAKTDLQNKNTVQGNAYNAFLIESEKYGSAVKDQETAEIKENQARKDLNNKSIEIDDLKKDKQDQQDLIDAETKAQEEKEKADKKVSDLEGKSQELERTIGTLTTKIPQLLEVKEKAKSWQDTITSIDTEHALAEGILPEGSTEDVYDARLVVLNDLFFAAINQRPNFDLAKEVLDKAQADFEIDAAPYYEAKAVYDAAVADYQVAKAAYEKAIAPKDQTVSVESQEAKASIPQTGNAENGVVGLLAVTGTAAGVTAIARRKKREAQN